MELGLLCWLRWLVLPATTKAPSLSLLLLEPALVLSLGLVTLVGRVAVDRFLLVRAATVARASSSEDFPSSSSA